MSTLYDLREDLRTSLEALDIHTFNHLPGVAPTPSAIVLAGSPYLEADQTYGSWVVNLLVYLSAAKGDNGSETYAVDELIQKAIHAIDDYDSLHTDGWTVEDVSQPFEFENANGQAFTVALTVTASGVTIN